MLKIDSNHPAFMAIRQSLLNERWLKLGIGLLFTSLGMLGLLWGMGGKIIFIVFSLLMLGGGGYFLKLTVDEWEVDNDELLNTLKNHPDHIVWVYSIVTQRMPFGFELSSSGILFFKLLDGNELSVALPAQKLKPITESLNKVLPHATFGFTKDREQWYMASLLIF